MGECDYVFKILLTGDSGVGKSSILLRFTDDAFAEDQPCTIGVDFKVKLVECAGLRINLTIWDTAGQEKFRSLTSSYYRGTHGIILVYDVTKRESFNNIDKWLSEVDLYANNDQIVKLLVGNKIDKPDREVSHQEGVEYARAKRMMYIETSAKTTVGIQQAFMELVQKILDTPSLYQEGRTSQRSGGIHIDDTPTNSSSQQSTCC